MRVLLFLCALAPLSSVPVTAQQQAPVRRPHCTFGEDDLPLVLALADLERYGDDVLPVAGKQLSAWEAPGFLWDRHRQGHGGKYGSPDPTLAEPDRVACASHALDALEIVATQRARMETALDVDYVARLLELHGRLDAAERLLLAAIDPESKEPGDSNRRSYGEFLARHRRFEEALPHIEQDQPMWGMCGLSNSLFRSVKFESVELCCEGLYGGTCQETLFDKRLDICGISGLAWYVAQRTHERGISDPRRDARAWFDRTMQIRRLPEVQVGHWTLQFEHDLQEWEESLHASPEAPEPDWKNPVEVERAVSRALAVARVDAREAERLLYSAAESGLPVVGHAVHHLVADRSIEWTEFDREYLMEQWIDGLLTRTYGYADPEDPATW